MIFSEYQLDATQNYIWENGLIFKFSKLASSAEVIQEQNEKMEWTVFKRCPLFLKYYDSIVKIPDGVSRDIKKTIQKNSIFKW